METEGDEREHELGDGGQKRKDVSEHHGPGGAVTDASGEPAFQGPPDGQPDDQASELGGWTPSQREEAGMEQEQQGEELQGERTSEMGNDEQIVDQQGAALEEQDGDEGNPSEQMGQDSGASGDMGDTGDTGQTGQG
jgi:hypothetical protein